MIDACANPQCKKPLHYLRDGRIFVFDVPSNRMAADGKRAQHLEHYWLCEQCAALMVLDHSPERGVALRAKAVAPSMPAGALVS